MSRACLLSDAALETTPLRPPKYLFDRLGPSPSYARHVPCPVSNAHADFNDERASPARHGIHVYAETDQFPAHIAYPLLSFIACIW